MSKYDSPYFNSERYYDPTAGAALMSLIREERKSINVIKDSKFMTDKDHEFAKIFSSFYNSTFGVRADGKVRRLARYKVIKQLVTTYNYCIAHIDDKDFSIEGTVDILGLGSDTTIKQVFTGNGNMGKVIICYKDWLKTGRFKWKTKECYVYYQPPKNHI